MKELFEIYRPGDLEYYAREYAETAWMVHVVGPDDVLLYSDGTDEQDGTVPHTRESAFVSAKAINELQEILEQANGEFNPFAQATVFFHGVPKKAPVEQHDAVQVIRARDPHSGETGVVGAVDREFLPKRPYLVEFETTSAWYAETELESVPGSAVLR